MWFRVLGLGLREFRVEGFRGFVVRGCGFQGIGFKAFKVQRFRGFVVSGLMADRVYCFE